MPNTEIVRMHDGQYGWRCTEHDATVGSWPEEEAAADSLAAHIRETHWVDGTQAGRKEET